MTATTAATQTTTGTTELGPPEGVALRPFDPAIDYEPVARLITRTNEFDDLDWVATVPQLQLEISPDGPYAPDRVTQVAVLEDVPVGFVRISSRQRGADKVVHRMELWTAPEQRRRGIGRALLSWAEGRAAEIRATGERGAPDLIHELSATVDDRHAYSHAFAEGAGYRVIRYSFEMRRPLDEPIPDAPLPAGLELRPVVDADLRRIFDANAEAFRDHWEAAERTDDDFRHWVEDPDLDISLWRVAWEGDEVAGVSVNTIYAEENRELGISVGWLDQVSVRRPWRRRGVGAAVIAASLAAFRERGMAEASLGVDAENPTGALALYERLGFRRFRSFRVYRKPVTAP